MKRTLTVALAIVIAVALGTQMSGTRFGIDSASDENRAAQQVRA